jgi:excisionase family DNA binding protein
MERVIGPPSTHSIILSDLLARCLASGVQERYITIMPRSTESKRLYSISESADDLGVSIPTLRRAVALNRLRTVTIGSRRLIADDELDRVKCEGLDLRKS